MARKWHLLHRALRSSLLRLLREGLFLYRSRWLAWFLAGFFLASSILPVASGNAPASLLATDEPSPQTRSAYSGILIAQGGSSTGELVRLGWEYYQEGDYVKAEEVLQQALGRLSELGEQQPNFNLRSTQILYARVLSKLGLYPRTCNTLIEGLDAHFLMAAREESSSESERKESSSESAREASSSEPEREKSSSELVEGDISCDRLAIGDEQKPHLREHLESILHVPSLDPWHLGQLIGWQSLGVTLRVLGQLEDSQIVLGLLVDALKDYPYPKTQQLLGVTQLSLANTFRAKGNLEQERQAPPQYEYTPWRCEPFSLSSAPGKEEYAESIRIYKELSEEQSDFNDIQIKSQVNHLSLLSVIRGANALAEAETLADKIIENPELSKSSSVRSHQLASARSQIYTRIDYAKSLACLQQRGSTKVTNGDVDDQMRYALEGAEELGDPEAFNNRRALSYVLGNWGALHEERQEFQQARDLTQEALLLAQPGQMPEVAYQWQWQLGRLHEAEGEIEEAIAAYEAAVQTLESVRGELLTVNSDVQFSFRDNVEPLYRTLIRLLLLAPDEGAIGQENLLKSISYIDALQLAELENFLRCSLQGNSDSVQLPQSESDDRESRVTALRNRLDRIFEIDPRAALIYAIVLDERLEIILAPPKQDLSHYTTHFSKELQSRLDDWLKSIYKPPGEREGINKDGGEQLYEIILPKPLNEKLLSNTDSSGHKEIETLVFVLDSQLRNIPLSVLYNREGEDGEGKYLIEDYALALAPVSALLAPKRLETEQFRVLAVGLSERDALPAASPLIGVRNSVEKILELSPRKGQAILGKQFNSQVIEDRLRSSLFQVVHFATHAQFSSNPEKTYVLTQGENLNVTQLEQLLRTRTSDTPESIELFVLSACQTAQGDKRATLGLSGVAVKAGAGSTLATLWSVVDGQTTDFMERFYQQLFKEERTVSEALRQTQIQYIKEDRKPFYWAGFVLVGNWL